MNKSKKLWTGLTARQELVSAAVLEMRMGRASNGHLACERVVSNWHPNTIGHAMYRYYMNTTDLALERLINEIERKAR